jgi:hypothetical protein
MTTFKVSFPAMQEFYARLNTIHGQLQDSTEQLIAQGTSATAEMQGETRDQMMAVHGTLYQKQGEMNDAHAATSNVVNGMYEEYFQGDRSAASMWT